MPSHIKESSHLEDGTSDGMALENNSDHEQQSVASTVVSKKGKKLSRKERKLLEMEEAMKENEVLGGVDLEGKMQVMTLDSEDIAMPAKKDKKKAKKDKKKNLRNDDPEEVLVPGHFVGLEIDELVSDDLELIQVAPKKDKKKAKKSKKKDVDTLDDDDDEDLSAFEAEDDEVLPVVVPKFNALLDLDTVEEEVKDLDSAEDEDSKVAVDAEKSGSLPLASKKEKKKTKKENSKKASQPVEDDWSILDEFSKKNGDAGEMSVDDEAQQKKDKRKAKKERQKNREAAGVTEEKQKDVQEISENVKEDDAKETSKKSKKKDKKKEKAAEKEVKKPSKMVQLIKEQQIAVQAELERQRLEEERKEREEDERLAALEKEEQLARERAERRKQKEKEKRQRLKDEGKLLTAKQKLDKQRALQMLEQRGLVAPAGSNAEMIGEKKSQRPVYSRVRKKDQHKPQMASVDVVPITTVDQQVTSTSPITVTIEKDSISHPEKSKPVEVEEVPDSWDDPQAEDIKVRALSESISTKIESTSTGADALESSESESSSSEDSSDSEGTSSSEEDSSEEETEDSIRIRIEKRKILRNKKRNVNNLRSAVVCVLGHVDTGKTKILDKLRKTNVQLNEVGGITQQIGATNVPRSAIIDSTKMCTSLHEDGLRLPGLLIIDTPGHESFGNLRNRGSSLCDVAILVVDIMHGIEPQTKESIKLLLKKKCPFVVALNKIDRLYQFTSYPDLHIRDVIAKQNSLAKKDFDDRLNKVVCDFALEELNVALFWDNPDPSEYISLVPTSAHSGDGMGNLVGLICEFSQTTLAERLSYSPELQAIVMEVKAIHGLGTTVDVILVNGQLRHSDTVVFPGSEGPIVTQIRDLLLPQPMRELRVKSQYIHCKQVIAAQGVKLIAKDLDNVLAGFPIFVAEKEDEIPILKADMAAAVKDALSSIKLDERGVYVQASTLGSLEALLEFLRTSKIPYAGINIGPVHRRDVIKASVMLEHDKMWAVVLAFDVKVEKEAQEYADLNGVKIFTADIIYHLFDRFTAYVDDLKKKQKEEHINQAVFPCKLRIIPSNVFKSRDPIVVGVTVEAGIVKTGTPICVPAREHVEIGYITSIEYNHKSVTEARKGTDVCVKIEGTPGSPPKMVGRHFEETDVLVSKICRESIDCLKNYFRDDMQKTDWQLIVELKKIFGIV